MIRTARILLHCLPLGFGIAVCILLPASAHAALTYVGSAEGSGNSAAYTVSLTSLTGGTGGAAQAGDLVIVATGFVNTADGNPGVTTSGYTEEADLYSNGSTDDANLSIDWKLMDPTPDTSVTCSGSGSSTMGAVCEVQVWRGADQTTPMDASVTTATATGAIAPNSPSITPDTSGAVVLTLGLAASASADTSVTAPTGYSRQSDIGVDPSRSATVGIASKFWSGSGAEDPAVWTTWTVASAGSTAMGTMAIRPVPEPPPTRVMRLFAGFIIKLFSGKIIIYGG